MLFDQLDVNNSGAFDHRDLAILQMQQSRKLSPKRRDFEQLACDSALQLMPYSAFLMIIFWFTSTPSCVMTFSALLFFASAAIVLGFNPTSAKIHRVAACVAMGGGIPWALLGIAMATCRMMPGYFNYLEPWDDFRFTEQQAAGFAQQPNLWKNQVGIVYVICLLAWAMLIATRFSYRCLHAAAQMDRTSATVHPSP